MKVKCIDTEKLILDPVKLGLTRNFVCREFAFKL